MIFLGFATGRKRQNNEVNIHPFDFGVTKLQLSKNRKILLLGLVVAGSIAKYLLAESGYVGSRKEVVE